MNQFAPLNTRQLAIKLRSAKTSPSHLNHSLLSRSFWFRHHRFWVERDNGAVQKLERTRRLYLYKYLKAHGRIHWWEKRSAQNTSNTSQQTRSSCSSKKPPGSSEQQNPDISEEMAAFEDFKRRIHADPYAALFGHRLDRFMLRSENHMWSSLNEALNSLNGPRKETCSSQSSKQSSTTQNESRGEKTQTRVSDDAANTEIPRQDAMHTVAIEYEYDPISMRKVPKPQNSSVGRNLESRPPASRRDSVDIPVKPFQQSSKNGDNGTSGKSHGETASFDTMKVTNRSKANETSKGVNHLALNKSGESGLHSQAAQSQDRRRNVVEGSTSALRGFRHIDPHREVEPPLFSGTTYEQKTGSNSPQGPSRPSQPWLNREGFKSEDCPSDVCSTVDQNPISKKPLSPQIEKLEPSLDRYGHGIRNQQPQGIFSPETSESQQERTSKSLKNDAREKLSAHWESLRNSAEATEEASRQIEALNQKRLNRSLVKPEEKALGQTSPRLQNASESQENSGDFKTTPSNICKPNIPGARSIPTSNTALSYDEKSLDPEMRDSPEQPDTRTAEIAQGVAYREKLHAEVLDEQARNQARTVALRDADKTAKADMAKVAEAGRALFRELKALYEQRYGKTDVNHRQEPLHSTEISDLTVESNTRELPSGKGAANSKKESLSERVGEIELGDWWKQRKARAAAEQQAGPEVAQHTCTCLFPRRQGKGEDALTENLTVGSEHLPKTPLRLPPQIPTLYKILAYDNSTHRVTLAETTSSIVQVNEESLLRTEVLPRLKHAAKFLPYLDALQAEGYDIVNGSGDLLILKKTKRGLGMPTARESVMSDELNRGRTTLSMGQRVRRRERVFSGSSRQRRKGERDGWDAGAGRLSRFGRTIKQVFVTSTVTAGLCYLIGVATEGSKSVDEEVHRPRGRPGIFSTQDSR